MNVAGFDEAEDGLGFLGALHTEAVDGGVGDVVEHDGGARVGVRHFKADIIQGETAHVAGE